MSQGLETYLGLCEQTETEIQIGTFLRAWTFPVNHHGKYFCDGYSQVCIILRIFEEKYVELAEIAQNTFTNTVVERVS
jgi:hypothetical protein